MSISESIEELKRSIELGQDASAAMADIPRMLDDIQVKLLTAGLAADSMNLTLDGADAGDHEEIGNAQTIASRESNRYVRMAGELSIFKDSATQSQRSMYAAKVMLDLVIARLAGS